MPTPRGTTSAGGQVWTLMQGLFLRGHETPRIKSNNCPKSDLRSRLGMDMHAHRFETLWDSVSTSTSTSFLVLAQKMGYVCGRKKKKRIPTKPTYAVCGSEVIWQVVCVAAVMTIGVSHKAAAKMNKCSRDPAGVKRTAESCPWPAKSGTGTEPDLDFRLPIRLLFREAILNICQIGLVVNHGSLGRE